MYADFDLIIPESLSEVSALIADPGWEGTALLAGGTNLLVDIRAGKTRPNRVVCLGRLDGLRRIAEDGDRIVVGGSTTVTDLLESPVMAAYGPSLVQASRVFAGLMVRNAATVAGNVAYGSPAADLVPPLMALDARIGLVSARGSREVPIDSYYTGYKEDIREPDELIAEISWRIPKAPFVNNFYKLARRRGDAITVTGVSVFVSVVKGRCDIVRIAVGAAAPMVMRVRQAETILTGELLTDERIEKAAEAAVAECNPIGDVRASADYRSAMVGVLTRRLLEDARDDLARRGELS